MKKKIASVLCFIVATVVLIANTNAQPLERPNLADLENISLPPIPDFQTRLSSANDWERIPFGRKISYAFKALYRSGDEIELADTDLELIELGSEGTPPNDRYFSALNQACEAHESQTSRGLAISIDYITQVFVNGQQYELEDKYNFYEELFNQVSVEAKGLLLEKIEAAQGRNLFSMSRIEWAILGQKNPNRLKAAFLKGCETLDSTIEAYNFNRENPDERALLTPIIGKQINDENQ